MEKALMDLIALARLLSYAHDEAMRLSADDAASNIGHALIGIRTQLEELNGSSVERTNRRYSQVIQ